MPQYRALNASRKYPFLIGAHDPVSHCSAVAKLCNLPLILDREAAERLPPLRQHANIHPRYSNGSCSDLETPHGALPARS
jgi:hypothetical protein